MEKPREEGPWEGRQGGHFRQEELSVLREVSGPQNAQSAQSGWHLGILGFQKPLEGVGAFPERGAVDDVKAVEVLCSLGNAKFLGLVETFFFFFYVLGMALG